MKTFALGLLLTLGAAGGIEHSQTDLQLIYSMITAAVGISLLAIGTQLIKE